MLAGCAASTTPSDGGTSELPDTGIPEQSCDSPEDCVAFGGVCRSGKCRADVPCADDIECGVGEQCLSKVCRFTGCATDSECPSGKCRKDVFSCVECTKNADCPSTRPACEPTSNTCVACANDSQCPSPGPGHCDAVSGACVHCLSSAQCPNGLTCNSAHVCEGAGPGFGCPAGIACGAGLSCVKVGAVQTCLQACSLYAPNCPSTEICYKLTFSDSVSLVFESTGPAGVCFNPTQGGRGYRESCVLSPAGHNCQPNLECIPEDAGVSLCRTFCDPSASGSCPPTEKCHTFPGDTQGRSYGVCYGDNGWGAPCTRDSTCRAGQSCIPAEDPSRNPEISGQCRFSVGSSPGLAACAAATSVDGGVIPADRTCASGLCRASTQPDSVTTCAAYCEKDVDCVVGTRSGTCDGQIAVTLKFGSAYARTCRPGCVGNSGCAEYGASARCKVELTAPGAATPAFRQVCGKNGGALPANAVCTTSASCASGFCLFDDGRGVTRQGRCASPCANSSECGDAGTACVPVTFFGSKGNDNQLGTADDVRFGSAFCAGGGCNEDSDCGDAGLRCVPDFAAADGGLALRCRPPTVVGSKEAGAPCSGDLECVSGACGLLQSPSTGSGRACFGACDVDTVCDAGLACRPGGMKFTIPGDSFSFDTCAP